MKNKEFYASEIVKLALNDRIIAVDKNTKKPCDCQGKDCEKCLLHDEKDNCKDNVKRKEWGEQEYEEQRVL